MEGATKGLKCNKCDGTIIYPEGSSGEKICNKCGIVFEEVPTFNSYTKWTPEWYSNWNEQDSETLKEWLTTLRAVSCQLNIPNFPYREEAARTIRTQNHLLFRSQKLSKNKRATVAALMHLILKEYDKSRSLKEISQELSLDNKSVMKKAWIINKTLIGEKTQLKNQRKTAFDYLHENSGKITQNKDLIHSAENTLMKIKNIGGNPIGLAAGALYYACKENKIRISKEKIGISYQISDRTVYTNEARIRKLLSGLATSSSISVCNNK
jgi:transcription initiation factor TFIIIB Brf1 subunit/transcription initiation factor TFIIB